MARDMVDRYRHWLDYENDVHLKVLQSLESVPADRRASPEFRRAATLFAHIVAARQIWLHRLGQRKDRPATIFPETVDLDAVSADWQGIQGEWRNYLAGIDDAELAKTFEYQSLDGGRFRNRIEDILTQTFGHSWYHRGQIAMLVKAAGGTPAATDLIYWCRESLGTSQ
jgi:uncharacterized damage-inducible protein DinB